MSPFLTTRRSLWGPGLAVLGASAGIGALLGLWLGARAWPLEIGVIVAVLLCLRYGRRLRGKREKSAPPPRTRDKLRVIPGGKSGYDLAKDDSTDSQRWLM